MLRSDTSPEYARQRVKTHLLRFTALHDQLTSSKLNRTQLESVEKQDNLFPDIDCNYWG
jgi:1,4-alpha-glucan branching enzyme